MNNSQLIRPISIYTFKCIRLITESTKFKDIQFGHNKNIENLIKNEVLANIFIIMLVVFI